MTPCSLTDGKVLVHLIACIIKLECWRWRQRSTLKH